MKDQALAASCGLYCRDCEYIGEKCSGYWYVQGKMFWAEPIKINIFLFRIIPYTIIEVNFIMTPIQAKAATGGTYRYSLRPMYMYMFVMLLGAGTVSASWIVILVADISMLLLALWQFLGSRPALSCTATPAANI